MSVVLGKGRGTGCCKSENRRCCCEQNCCCNQKAKKGSGSIFFGIVAAAVIFIILYVWAYAFYEAFKLLTGGELTIVTGIAFVILITIISIVFLAILWLICKCWDEWWPSSNE